MTVEIINRFNLNEIIKKYELTVIPNNDTILLNENKLQEVKKYLDISGEIFIKNLLIEEFHSNRMLQKGFLSKSISINDIELFIQKALANKDIEVPSYYSFTLDKFKDTLFNNISNYLRESDSVFIDKSIYEYLLYIYKTY